MLYLSFLMSPFKMASYYSIVLLKFFYLKTPKYIVNFLRLFHHGNLKINITYEESFAYTICEVFTLK